MRQSQQEAILSAHALKSEAFSQRLDLNLQCSRRRLTHSCRCEVSRAADSGVSPRLPHHTSELHRLTMAFNRLLAWFSCILLIWGVAGCSQKSTEQMPAAPMDSPPAAEESAEKLPPLPDQETSASTSRAQEPSSAEPLPPLVVPEQAPKERRTAMAEDASSLIEGAPNAEVQQEAERLLQLIEQGEEVESPLLTRQPRPVLVAPTEEPRMLENLETVRFDLDKTEIRPEYEEILRRNLEWMRQNPEAKVQLEGHADERGTSEYNLALGERRARAVFEAMVRMGANPEQMNIISYGEERPLIPGKSEAAYSQNRRVEFTIF